MKGAFLISVFVLAISASTIDGRASTPSSSSAPATDDRLWSSMSSLAAGTTTSANETKSEGKWRWKYLSNGSPMPYLTYTDPDGKTSCYQWGTSAQGEAEATYTTSDGKVFYGLYDGNQYVWSLDGKIVNFTGPTPPAEYVNQDCISNVINANVICVSHSQQSIIGWVFDLYNYITGAEAAACCNNIRGVHYYCTAPVLRQLSNAVLASQELYDMCYYG